MDKKTRDKHIPVRVTSEEFFLLKDVAEERSSSVSSVVRWAISVALKQYPPGKSGDFVEQKQ